MKAGATEFLTKPFRDQDLLDAIQQALERDRVARQHSREVAELRARFDALTSREKEVMRLVVAGLLNKQIGFELGISEITVKIHRGRVMSKMGAQSLAELVRMTERLEVPTAKNQPAKTRVIPMYNWFLTGGRGYIFFRKMSSPYERAESKQQPSSNSDRR